MSQPLEFWFDIGSPAAFLAWTQLDNLHKKTGAEIHYRPMLLGGVFKATGNRAPASVVSKGQYMLKDLMRHAERYQVSLVFNPFFPVNTLQIMRGLTAWLDSENFKPALELLYSAMWQQGKNLADPDVVRSLLNDNGLDGEDFITQSNDPAIKEKLKSLTEQAVDKGIFGAPSFIVGDELFFGQDRLDFVVEALQ